ncbi:hypothetical protein [Azospirillum sp. sgz302134]
MQTTKQPYELLVRWDRNGHLAGAHVQFRYVTLDGSITSETLGPAQPVALGAADGFPLGDILSEVQASALADLEAARAELAAIRKELENLRASTE